MAHRVIRQHHRCSLDEFVARLIRMPHQEVLIRINLDNPTTVYVPGQPISGKVVITVPSQYEVKAPGVKLSIVGRAQVRWMEAELGAIRPVFRGVAANQDSMNVLHTAHESFFEYNTRYAFTSGKAKVSIGGATEHSYPFHYTLPKSIPTSFEGKHGRVVYYCKAEMELVSKGPLRSIKFFTVNAVLDLNLYHNELEHPVTKRDVQSMCCLCCASGPITATLMIPRTGYVAGEVVYISGELSNFSRTPIASTKATLSATIVFTESFMVKKYSNRVLKEIVRGEVQPGTTDFWDNVPLRIPSVPPTRLGLLCHSVDVQYEVKLSATPTLATFHLVVSIPIVIGNVPLESQFNHFYRPLLGIFENDDDVVMDSTMVAPLAHHVGEPEPDFFETSFAEQNPCHYSDDTAAARPYKPLYAYYRAKDA